jgi:glucose-1-phosphate thymidylyltransferase
VESGYTWGRTQRWRSADAGRRRFHARDTGQADTELLVSSAATAPTADYHPGEVGENVSLAIVDAVAAPVGEHRLESCSPYLASIANVPLIWHVFDELAEGGVERAMVVAHTDVRRELERVLEGGKSWGIEVSYSDAPQIDGKQRVLTQTRQTLASGPVLVYPADCLFPGQVAVMRDRFSEGDVDCVLLALAPESSLPGSRLFSAPVMLGPRTLEVVSDSLSRNLEPRGLAEILLAGGCRVAMCQAAKQWSYSDLTERRLAANRMVLDDLPVPAVDGSFPDNNEIQGRVAISPRARVSNSRLCGPIAIDDDAVVEDSFVGPYTAIGRGAVVRGTELDNTMILPFAEVLHPGVRIEASIIGERASISRSYELPKGLHLRLAAGSRVSLS